MSVVFLRLTEADSKAPVFVNPLDIARVDPCNVWPDAPYRPAYGYSEKAGVEGAKIIVRGDQNVLFTIEPWQEVMEMVGQAKSKLHDWHKENTTIVGFDKTPWIARRIEWINAVREAQWKVNEARDDMEPFDYREVSDALTATTFKSNQHKNPHFGRPIMDVLIERRLRAAERKAVGADTGGFDWMITRATQDPFNGHGGTDR